MQSKNGRKKEVLKNKFKVNIGTKEDRKQFFSVKLINVQGLIKAKAMELEKLIADD